MQRPHVVILGAGASRATCPNGDKKGNRLPLMSDFTEIVGLKSLLHQWGINPRQNFEEIFSDLYERSDIQKTKKIQSLIQDYFSQLQLPDSPTIYDHLVLSLREKDLIAAFNWDPLLMQAYLRNSRAGLSLPKLVFLHGNVSVGCCEMDKTAGLLGVPCKKCKQPYKTVPLLYPIKKKNYAANLFIAEQWRLLKRSFKDAFMITIFGYSGPKADQEAIAAMKDAWGINGQRSMEQTAFIIRPGQNEDEIHQAWDAFIHSHHYEIHEDFYDSWIAKHPRRTGEAYINQYLAAQFIEDNLIPKENDFQNLWNWFEQFKSAETRMSAQA